jgi:hypothetical protein
MPPPYWFSTVPAPADRRQQARRAAAVEQELSALRMCHDERHQAEGLTGKAVMA